VNLVSKFTHFVLQNNSFCSTKKRGKEHGARARERVERQKQKGQVCKNITKREKKNILLGCSDYNQ
jgi:hypothetical protein